MRPAGWPARRCTLEQHDLWENSHLSPLLSRLKSLRASSSSLERASKAGSWRPAWSGGVGSGRRARHAPVSQAAVLRLGRIRCAGYSDLHRTGEEEPLQHPGPAHRQGLDLASSSAQPSGEVDEQAVVQALGDENDLPKVLPEFGREVKRPLASSLWTEFVSSSPPFAGGIVHKPHFYPLYLSFIILCTVKNCKRFFQFGYTFPGQKFCAKSESHLGIFVGSCNSPKGTDVLSKLVPIPKQFIFHICKYYTVPNKTRVFLVFPTGREKDGVFPAAGRFFHGFCGAFPARTPLFPPEKQTASPLLSKRRG